MNLNLCQCFCFL